MSIMGLDEMKRGSEACWSGLVWSGLGRDGDIKQETPECVTVLSQSYIYLLSSPIEFSPVGAT